MNFIELKFFFFNQQKRKMAASLSPIQSSDGLTPAPATFWNSLSQDDKNEYLRLRQSFHNGQKISSKDRRIVTFRKELNIVLQYLERSPENMEARCILIGVCFVGPLICVNTRQLKSFLSRCKSSINGSFQQLGYVALKTKAKARNCCVAVLPSLQNHQTVLRQWTVRVAGEEAPFCFVSSFSYVGLPDITDEDLFDEKPKPIRSNSSHLNTSSLMFPHQFLPQQQQSILNNPLMNDANFNNNQKTVTFGNIYQNQPLQNPPNGLMNYGISNPQNHLINTQPTANAMPNNNAPTISFRPKMIEDDLPSLSIDSDDFNNIGSPLSFNSNSNNFLNNNFPPMTSSLSLDCFVDYDTDWMNANVGNSNLIRNDDDNMQTNDLIGFSGDIDQQPLSPLDYSTKMSFQKVMSSGMKRSQSAFSIADDWDLFSDHI